ncbi:hypothetical protein VIGAN_08308200 [Vigna angularis var. angularis]|uniref:Knottin scorpion toxin-like domain-containing protein n=1 Tax=Vigna angularis var. angularis TaxID=157739 RepID=A0A0S3STP6_PHAAN|nr:hypothetical protein VIGAN_08308200 [Vigna angularis var. angularis]
MSRYSLISILLKVLLAVTMIVVISSGVMSSKQICHGTCTQFPDCNGHCKFLGYESGTCVPFPLTRGASCCCS